MSITVNSSFDLMHAVERLVSTLDRSERHDRVRCGVLLLCRNTGGLVTRLLDAWNKASQMALRTDLLEALRSCNADQCSPLRADSVPLSAEARLAAALESPPPSCGLQVVVPWPQSYNHHDLHVIESTADGLRSAMSHALGGVVGANASAAVARVSQAWLFDRWMMQMKLEQKDETITQLKTKLTSGMIDVKRMLMNVV